MVAQGKSNLAQNNLFSDLEVEVLKCLLVHLQLNQERPTSDISQIAQSCGIRDNDEILRALYTLEGKNLVQPDPIGDFTSNHWRITEIGLKALQFISLN